LNVFYQSFNKSLIYIVIFFSLTASLSAAVQLEVTNKGNKETIWSDGENLHIQAEGELGYLLLNPVKRQLFTINPSQKQIVNLSGKIKQSPKIPKMNDTIIDVVEHGAGPKMRGYETMLYLLKVNGEICRSEYLAKSVEELTNVIAGLELMTEYKIITTFGSLPAQLDLCFVAEHMSYKRFSKHGFPVKSNDQYEKTEFEMISINKFAKNPPNDFKLPEGFTVISYEDAMASTGMPPMVGTGHEMHPPQ